MAKPVKDAVEGVQETVTTGYGIGAAAGAALIIVLAMAVFGFSLEGLASTVRQRLPFKFGG